MHIRLIQFGESFPHFRRDAQIRRCVCPMLASELSVPSRYRLDEFTVVKINGVVVAVVVDIDAVARFFFGQLCRHTLVSVNADASSMRVEFHFWESAKR